MVFAKANFVNSHESYLDYTTEKVNPNYHIEISVRSHQYSENNFGENLIMEHLAVKAAINMFVGVENYWKTHVVF